MHLGPVEPAVDSELGVSLGPIVEVISAVVVGVDSGSDVGRCAVVGPRDMLFDELVRSGAAGEVVDEVSVGGSVDDVVDGAATAGLWTVEVERRPVGVAPDLDSSILDTAVVETDSPDTTRPECLRPGAGKRSDGVTTSGASLLVCVGFDSDVVRLARELTRPKTMRPIATRAPLATIGPNRPRP